MTKAKPISYGMAGFGGRLVQRSELDRLKTILQSFPTSADEDAKLLTGTLLHRVI
jgi:hypothetical protein